MKLWVIYTTMDDGSDEGYQTFVAGVYTDEQSARLAHQRLCTPVEQEHTVSVSDFGMCLTEHTEATDDPCTIRFAQIFRNLGGVVGNDGLVRTWTEKYFTEEIESDVLL